MSSARLWIYGKDNDHLGVITVNNWASGGGKLVLSIEPKKVKPKQLDNGMLEGKGGAVICYRNDKGDKFQDHYSGVTLKDVGGTSTNKNGVIEEAELTSLGFTYKSIVKKVKMADCLLPEEVEKITTSNMKNFELIELCAEVLNKSKGV